MAKIDTVGIEDIEKMIEKRGLGASKAVDAMLEAGADIVVNAQKVAVGTMFASDRSTGALMASIKKSGLKGNEAARHIEVAPTGTDKHGVRNAEKGFVLEYGRTNMRAKLWMSAANAKCANEVQDKMREVWEAAQNGK